MSAAAEHHLDLLAAARVVQRSAVDGDVDELHGDLCRLRKALVADLHDDERDQHVSEAGRRVARAGREQLLHFVNDLLATSTGPDREDCSCLVRAAEVRAMLIRQVRLQGNLGGQSARR